MSTKELKRLHLIKKSEDKLITQIKAANMLNLSDRQFRRLIAKFRKYGDIGIIHQNRGKISPRKIKPEIITNVVDLYQSEFLGYKPTFFAERLADEYNISIIKNLLGKYLLITISGHQKRKNLNIVPNVKENTMLAN